MSILAARSGMLEFRKTGILMIGNGLSGMCIIDVTHRTQTGLEFLLRLFPKMEKESRRKTRKIHNCWPKGGSQIDLAPPFCSSLLIHKIDEEPPPKWTKKIDANWGRFFLWILRRFWEPNWPQVAQKFDQKINSKALDFLSHFWSNLV